MRGLNIQWPFSQLILLSEKLEEVREYDLDYRGIAKTNEEVSAQAVSYTTGVPPVSGAAMFFKGEWSGAGVFNVEQFPAKPFLEDVAQRGLPWHVIDVDGGDQEDLFAVET